MRFLLILAGFSVLRAIVFLVLVDLRRAVGLDGVPECTTESNWRVISSVEDVSLVEDEEGDVSCTDGGATRVVSDVGGGRGSD